MDKMRRCIGCNEIKNAKSMIKITKNYKTGEIIVNPPTSINGRSVYVCNDENCINIAFKKDRLDKNLKKKLTEEEKESVKILLNNMVVVKH